VKLPRATLDREARRQGERAQKLRRQADDKPWREPQAGASGAGFGALSNDHSTGCWNIRERDAWGKTGRCVKRPGTERWHWVYTGTCFDGSPGKTAGGRPVISERGFVARVKALLAWREQCMPRPCGAVWVRRPGCWSSAMARLWIGVWPTTGSRRAAAFGFFTTRATFGGCGRALFGEDPAKPRAGYDLWCDNQKPIGHQSRGAIGRDFDRTASGAAADAVQKEVITFRTQDRMDYRAGRRRGEPSAAEL